MTIGVHVLGCIRQSARAASLAARGASFAGPTLFLAGRSVRPEHAIIASAARGAPAIGEMFVLALAFILLGAVRQRQSWGGAG